ncbi:helix-turn-helix domain-containing protein [Mesorhizobium sp. L-8-3]|uniref:helix-turn-helix domain-containing protein n=1 Tax=Mesorhizobium sp. L-8-3 TaxID=2744522 RepID=UPI0019270A59|nr:helix-turn-helix domain-containing protein [Mesorhizobium sp. L-8-3]BCH25778.1 hypothetical protein MesoLjLb_55630 [Mesorhizobium sp. L-8-3]
MTDYSVSELATYAGISRQRMWQLIKDGKGPATFLEIKGNGRTRIKIDWPDAVRWMAERYPKRAQLFVEVWMATTVSGTLQ